MSIKNTHTKTHPRRRMVRPRLMFLLLCPFAACLHYFSRYPVTEMSALKPLVGQVLTMNYSRIYKLTDTVPGSSYELKVHASLYAIDALIWFLKLAYAASCPTRFEITPHTQNTHKSAHSRSLLNTEKPDQVLY